MVIRRKIKQIIDFPKRPEPGELFITIKDCHMDGIGELVYKKGKVYKSEIIGCITDELGRKNHYWQGSDWRIYFRKFNHKRNSIKNYGIN